MVKSEDGAGTNLGGAPSLYGSKGMGAQRAAWLEAFRAEAAVIAGEEQAQALMDLSKAFETVDHSILMDADRASGSPLGLRPSPPTA